MIQFDKVTKGYGNSSTRALDEVSFEVQAGELVALVGGSGSGKTTTLKCINRLVEPDSGEIYLNGTAVRMQPGSALRRHIGYVFQGIGLFPHLSVAENIGITPQLLGWERARIATRVDELLDLVELPRDFARALACGALGRTASARRRGARTRRGAQSRVDGRALRRARSRDARHARASLPQAARADAADDCARDT